MTELRLTHCVHRGSVLAHGLMIDLRWVPLAVARERVLALYTRGLRLLSDDSHWFVLFPEPRRVQCAQARGAPLLQYSASFSMAPLTAAEMSQLELTVPSVVLAADGCARVRPLSELRELDPADWLDLSDFGSLSRVEALAEIVSAPKPAHAAPPADLRRALGVAAAAPERAEFLAALAREEPVVAKRWLIGLVKRLWRVSAPVTRSQLPALRKRSPTFARLRAAWAHWVSRARIGMILGWRQARYLRRMLDLFESGQLEDALKHAIPLGGKLRSSFERPALGLPRPRADLTIATGPSTVGSAYRFGDNLFAHLRETYRQAFKRLAELRQIEKAAFVLVELLQQHEEAVSYLQLHGRYRLAAQIAEAHELAPGLVIRAWFLAGDHERAVQVARRTGAFADAVLRLQSHPEHARALRLLWADALCRSGAYAAAVDVIWPEPSARGLALAWAERACALGGATGARMLVRRLQLSAAAFGEVRDSAAALMRAPGEDAAVCVRAFARAVVEAEQTPELRVLAQATARRLLEEPADAEGDQLLRRVLDMSGDALLRADVWASGRMRKPRSGPPIQVRAACTQRASTCACRVATQSSLKSTPQLRANATAHGLVLGMFNEVQSWEEESRPELLQRACDAAVFRLRDAFHLGASDSVESAAGGMLEAFGCAARVLDVAPNPVFCTAALATLAGTHLVVAHIGDVRVYVLRGDVLAPITRDHTLANEPPAGLGDHADSLGGILTRTLARTDRAEIDVCAFELQDGDAILLCNARCWEADLERVRVHAQDPERACAELNQAGSPHSAICVATFSGKGLRASGRTALHVERVVDAGKVSGLPLTAALRGRRTPIEHTRLAADRGALAALDAAELPDGRMLVALGELGVQLLSAEGRVQARYAEPAHQIVLSDHGDRALLVAARGPYNRVTRLDLTTGRCQFYCQASFDRWAQSFDGATWFVAQDNTLFAIDVTADDWAHSWKVDGLPGPIQSIRRDASTLSVLLPAALEVWIYEVPSLALRRREALAQTGIERGLSGISANGLCVAWRAHDTGALPELYRAKSWHALPVTTQAAPTVPQLSAAWVALPTLDQDGLEVTLLDLAELQPRLRLRLECPPPGPYTLRFQDEHLVVADTAGRVLVVSLRSGAVLREFRLA